MKAVLFSLVFSACICPAQEHPASEMAIRHVTVVNVATGAELREQTVRIQGDRIVSIEPTQEADAALPGSIDAHGGFLIPGLWDMHIHVHDTNELPLYIANGVTGVRIMSGSKQEAAYRAELARQEISPEIYLASAIVDGDPPYWPGSIVVKKAAEARRAVGEIKANGADFIKVYDSLSREAYFALADEAKLQHIPFEGHVPEAVTAQEASNAGQRSIEHLTGLALACSSKQDVVMAEIAEAKFFRDKQAVEAEALRSFDQAKCVALFKEFRSNDTWQVPTFTVLRMRSRLDDSKVTSDARLAYIGRRSRDRWSDRTQPLMQRGTNATFQMMRGILSADEKLVGAMSSAGVPLMAGTDAMNPYCFPGFSLHDELALMVDAGLTPLHALQAATMNPAKFMGRSSELGTVEAGKMANLVLLRGDPLADIRNTAQLRGVWLKGRYFDEAALVRMLERAKEAAKH
jgi:hypothetical protein